ncbi:MAG: hypothetical protein GZ085_12065 [Sulfuriferula multivorans]|uniref:Uncharacterized protein n=1 Tax=Sulfuriferula multivorans TaxID=1559896 RepID=A0A7C9P909_9PROT|nr:hypothetical protein [Sulfuriferula multivorans]
MLRLPESLNAWASSEFGDVFKQEVEQLDGQHLPLQQGLAATSHVSERPIQVMILGVTEEAECIRVRAGIFYTGVISGCNCADDPSPIDEQNEYCVVQIDIHRTTAESTVGLVKD